MTSTTAPKVKDQELVSFGLVESVSVNSNTDFTPSKLNPGKVVTDKESEEFVNLFICHLIFYAVFCVSLVLHIFIDLGLGSFIKKKFIHLIKPTEKIDFKKTPVFA
tara:strand:+ start:277 stop:594 length:318 start_codon:yes stop_codon:yes gene_type:complete